MRERRRAASLDSFLSFVPLSLTVSLLYSDYEFCAQPLSLSLSGDWTF